MSTHERTMPTTEVIGLAREFFAEAYEGPQSHGSWFVTAAPDAGLFGTIAPLGADAASRPARPGGPSIAAHVEHLRWSLANVNATVRGAPWNADWSASWSVREVDEKAWAELRRAVRAEYDELHATLAAEPPIDDPTMLRGILALAPHAAYHLGAVRQIAAGLEPGRGG